MARVPHGGGTRREHGRRNAPKTIDLAENLSKVLSGKVQRLKFREF
jgi:acyl-coenzyme A synthetase/AMP-(fatty) acid ligase